MKILVTTKTNSDDLETQHLSIDGRKCLHVGPLCDCPEDAIIGRDLVSCSDVAAYMQMAYDAAKRGEEFVVEYVDA